MTSLSGNVNGCTDWSTTLWINLGSCSDELFIDFFQVADSSTVGSHRIGKFTEFAM